MINRQFQTRPRYFQKSVRTLFGLGMAYFCSSCSWLHTPTLNFQAQAQDTNPALECTPEELKITEPGYSCKAMLRVKMVTDKCERLSLHDPFKCPMAEAPYQPPTTPPYQFLALALTGNDKALRCMANNLFHEANIENGKKTYEPYLGQQAVLMNVFNRMTSGLPEVKKLKLVNSNVKNAPSMEDFHISKLQEVYKKKGGFLSFLNERSKTAIDDVPSDIDRENIADMVCSQIFSAGTGVSYSWTIDGSKAYLPLKSTELEYPMATIDLTLKLLTQNCAGLDLGAAADCASLLDPSGGATMYKIEDAAGPPPSEIEGESPADPANTKIYVKIGSHTFVREGPGTVRHDRTRQKFDDPGGTGEVKDIYSSTRDAICGENADDPTTADVRAFRKFLAKKNIPCE